MPATRCRGHVWLALAIVLNGFGIAAPLCASDAQGPSSDAARSATASGPAVQAPAELPRSAADRATDDAKPLPPSPSTSGEAATLAQPEASEVPAKAPVVEPQVERLGPQKLPGHVEIEPVHFNGVHLGVSTADEVQELWGEPEAIRPGDPFIEHVYRIDPFERIELTFYRGKVLSIVITLKERFAPSEVARQLGLIDYEPVTVRDDRGAPLGQAWPERGVIFTYASDLSEPKVAQIVLEVIDPQPFVLRAQSRLADNYTGCLDDIATALQLDPKYAQAWWLKGRLLLKLGRRDDALEACQKAIELDPKHAEYQLWLGKALVAVGRFEEAAHHTQEAVSLSGDQPHIRARAMLVLGEIVAAGPRRDYHQAMEFHLQAIRLAEPLVSEPRVAVRRTAKEVLIEAHLAVASDIAWGDWQSKDTVVPRWLERASKLATETISNDGIHSDMHWRVCQQALAAHVGLRGELDPKPWAERLLRMGRQQIEATEDPLRRRHLEWEVGLGLYDALQCYHARGEAGPALEYGALAVNYLERGLVGRQEVAGDAYLMGRLYFRIGWVYAVQKQDHRTALGWFQRAVPLVERDIPDSALADRGRQGETLVSMAVTYWTMGQRQRAVELTHKGMDLMQTAVRQGILAEQALVVPYSNLAAMHRQLGEEDKARNFTELAERYTADANVQR